MGMIDIIPMNKFDAGGRSPDNKTFSQNSRLYYTATVDDPVNDTALTVQYDPRTPQLRSPFPYGGYMRATNVQVTKQTPLMYQVAVDYESPSKPGENPLDQAPVVEFDWISTEAKIDTDINGAAIIMVTGEEFNPHPPITLYEPVVRVTRNVATYDPNFWAQYARSVNADYFYGLPPGTVRLIPPKARSVEDDDQQFVYWVVSAEFQIRRAAPGSTDLKAWYLRLRAQGMYVYTANPTNESWTAAQRVRTKGRMQSDRNKETTEPVMHATHDGGGYHEGEQIFDNTLAQWYEWEVFEPLPYSALGLL